MFVDSNFLLVLLLYTFIYTHAYIRDINNNDLLVKIQQIIYLKGTVNTGAWRPPPAFVRLAMARCF